MIILCFVRSFWSNFDHKLSEVWRRDVLVNNDQNFLSAPQTKLTSEDFKYSKRVIWTIVMFSKAYFATFGAWQYLITIHLHWIETISVDILLNISLCVQSKMHVNIFVHTWTVCWLTVLCRQCCWKKPPVHCHYQNQLRWQCEQETAWKTSVWQCPVTEIKSWDLGSINQRMAHLSCICVYRLNWYKNLFFFLHSLAGEYQR